MRLSMRPLLAAAFVLLAPLAHAEEPLHVTYEGLSLDLTPAGLGFAAGVARAQLAGRLQNQPLPNVGFEVPVLFNARAEGITYSVKLRELGLAPATDALDVAALIEDVEVHIDHLRLESWLFPELGTSCYGTTIHIGNGSDLPASARLGARLEDGRVVLDVQSLDFALSSEQYATDGPQHCIGPFDIQDYISPYVVAAVLGEARPVVELGVQLGLREVIPSVGDALNDLAGAKLPLALPDLVVLPATKVLLGFKPYALELTPEKLSLKLSLFIRRDETEARLPRARAAANGILLGHVGVNPHFLSAVTAVTMPHGSLPVELHPEAHQLVALLTGRDAMASILPDLSAAPLESDRLRLFVRFLAPPTFAQDDAGNLLVGIPSMEWRYQVLEQGAWRDYFLMSIKAQLGLRLSSAPSELRFKVTGGEVAVDGRWAPGYAPRDATFDRETAQAFFGSLVQILAEAEEPVAMRLPSLPVGGHELTIGGLGAESPFLSFDLFAARP